MHRILHRGKCWCSKTFSLRLLCMVLGNLHCPICVLMTFFLNVWFCLITKWCSMTPLIHITSYMLTPFHSVVFSHLQLASMKTDNRPGNLQFPCQSGRCQFHKLCSWDMYNEIFVCNTVKIWHFYSQIWRSKWAVDMFWIFKARYDDYYWGNIHKSLQLILTMTSFHSIIHHQQQCPADFAEIAYVLMTVRCIKSSIQRAFRVLCHAESFSSE